MKITAIELQCQTILVQVREVFEVNADLVLIRVPIRRIETIYISRFQVRNTSKEYRDFQQV